MHTNTNFDGVTATLTFTGSVPALAQILALSGASGLTSANVDAAAASSSDTTASSSVKPAAKSKATTPNAGNAAGSTASEPASGSASTETQDQATAGQAATDAAGSEGNATLSANADTGQSSKTGTTEANSSTSTASGGTATNAASPSDVTYEQVSAATLNLAKAKGRDAAVAVLGQFGVDHGSKLKPEQWAGYVSAVADKLAA